MAESSGLRMLRSRMTEARSGGGTRRLRQRLGWTSGEERNHVERASAEGKHPLRSVQLMRGLAAVMVLVLHATEVATERFGSRQQNWWAGAAGVDLFFVISGFVMSLSSGRLLKRRGGALEFLRRRVERVVPIYWIATTVKVGLLLWVPMLGLRGLGGSWHIVASYLFLPSWNTVHAALPVVPLGWTLNFEMLYYALFALALALKVPPLRMLTPMLIVMAMVPVVVHASGYALLTWCQPILIEFLFGMMLERGWRRGWKLRPEIACAVLCVAMILLVSLPGQDGAMLRPFLWGLPAVAMLGAALSLEDSAGRRAPQWMLLIGDASYSIYLTHGFVLPVLAKVLAVSPWSGARHMVSVVVASLVLCLCAGLLFYRWVELPLIRFFHRRRTAALAFG